MIFLTATPHSGDEDAFGRLLSLIDPSFGTMNFEDARYRERLARHFVQRQRIDLVSGDWDENRAFPKHETTESPYRLSQAHLDFRFHDPERPLAYNIWQKLSYVGVIFVLLPLVILTGLALSPNMDAAWPWLIELFGGRQSARSIHFLCMIALTLFVIIHLSLVILAGPLNEVRSVITGWWRVPEEPRP